MNMCILGQNGNLVVIVRSYNIPVVCGPTDLQPRPQASACKTVLDSLTVSTNTQSFHRAGQTGAGLALPRIIRAGRFSPLIYVPSSIILLTFSCAPLLPKLIKYLAHSRCTVVYGIRGTSNVVDRARWFDLWAALEAVDAVCTPKGKVGGVKELGKSAPKSFCR